MGPWDRGTHHVIICTCVVLRYSVTRVIHTDPKQLYYLHQWYHLPISGTGDLPSVVPSPLSGTIPSVVPSHQQYHPLQQNYLAIVVRFAVLLSLFLVIILRHIHMTNDCWTAVGPLLDRGFNRSVKLTHFPVSVS